MNKLTVFCTDKNELSGDKGKLLKTLLAQYDVKPSLHMGGVETLPPGVPVLALDKGAQKALGITTPEMWTHTTTEHWAIGGVTLGMALFDPTQAFSFMKLIEKATKLRNAYAYPPNVINAIDDPYPLPDLNQDFGRTVVDIETDTTDWRDPEGKIFLVGILTERGDCWILTRPYLEQPETQAWLRALWAQHSPRIGGHNFKFDVLFEGREFGVPLVIGWDTISMVNSYHESWHKGLKDLATYFYDADNYEERLVKSWLKANAKKGVKLTYADVPYPQMREYLICDLGYNLQLSFDLEALLKEVGRWEWPYLNHEIPQVNLLAEVEANGFAVDLGRIELEIAAMQADAVRLRQTIYDLSSGAIQNPGSDPQVRNYLFTIKGRQPTRFTKKTGAGSVVEKVLVENKDIPAIAAVLAWNRVTKLLSSYLVNIKGFVYQDKHGVWRVHPVWKHWNVITHRLSTEAPAIQTIPHRDAAKDTIPLWLFESAGLEMREGFELNEDGTGVIADYGTVIKSVYVAAPGNVLLTMDGKGWELTVCTAWAQDEFLTKLINADVDVHGIVCDDIYGKGRWTKAQRVKEKNVLFGWIYKGTVYAFVMETGLPEHLVQRAVDYLNKHCLGIVAWQNKMFEQAKTGSIKIPFFNYEIHFDLLINKVLKELRKNACNYPIQGVGSMLISRAAYLAREELRQLGFRIVALVHDDFTTEGPARNAYKAAKVKAHYLAKVGAEFNPGIKWNAEFKVGLDWARQTELKLEQIKEVYGE